MELWELIAREEIRDCIARYNANTDSGRMEQVVQVYAPDGIHETNGKKYEGREAIRAFMMAMVEEGRSFTPPPPASGPMTPMQEWIARGRVPFIRHFVATTQIDVESQTFARARSYYLFLTVHGLDHWGRYIDEFKPVDGKWLIKHRREVTDAQFAGGYGSESSSQHVADWITRPLSFPPAAPGGAK